MTTPPRGDAEEPAPFRETGLGWPDQQPPSPPSPPPPPVDPVPPVPAPPASPAAPPPWLTPPARSAPPRPPLQSPLRAQRYSPQLPAERPGPVTAAAVILFISAGLGVLVCCGINYLASEAGLADDETTFLAIFSVIIVVVSLFNAVLGYFILQGRQWARITTIVLCALGIAGSVISMVASSAGNTNPLSTCIGVILNIVVIGLLSGARASDYFRYGRG